MKVFIACIYTVFFSIHIYCQELPVARNYQDAFNKNTRSANGKPGINYWQNTAAYTIDISFAPATRIIAGTENITYTNNSPDTLNQVWFKLYPNLYKKGSQRDQDIDKADINDGVRIENFAINGNDQSTDDLYMYGTYMFLYVPPLLPGQQRQFSIGFSYEL